MPTFFLTLTADECSELRWEEIGDLEAFLQKIDNSMSWQDAPVECARLFVARCRAFIRDHILKDDGILGRVQHHMIRWEAQHRGSLHAHVLLWVDDADADRVADEIMAYVPAAYDEQQCSWIAPDPISHPHEHALYKIVLRKQLHSCTEWTGKAKGCRDDKGRCKMHFPFKPSPSFGTTFDAATQRYVYCRLRNADRNVIPFHPTVALLWNDHSNLQRINCTDWSFYVLKYAVKSEPAG